MTKELEAYGKVHSDMFIIFHYWVVECLLKDCKSEYLGDKNRLNHVATHVRTYGNAKLWSLFLVPITFSGQSPPQAQNISQFILKEFLVWNILYLEMIKLFPRLPTILILWHRIKNCTKKSFFLRDKKSFLKEPHLYTWVWYFTER